MKQQLRILLLEDSIDDVTLIEHLLRKEGISFDSRVVDTKDEYEQHLREFQPDVVISDHSLPQFNSIQALELYHEYKREHQPASAFVLVTGTVSEEFAVKIMKQGADDYILKDRLKRLPSAILNALEKNKSREEGRQAEEEKLQLLEVFQKSLYEIYVIDPQTLRFKYMNDQARENLGYTKEEITEMTPADIILDFDEVRFRGLMNAVKKSAKGRIYERFATRKDGTKYPIQIHMQVVQYGSETRYLANVLDITEDKEHQRQKELALFIQNSFDESRSLQESLELISEELGRRSGMAAVEIWTTDFDHAHIKRYGLWRKPGNKAPQLGKFFAEKAFRTGTYASSENIKHEQLIIEGELLQETAYEGIIAYPIKTGQEITAVINFFAEVIKSERDPLLYIGEGVQDKLAVNIKRKKTEEELQHIFNFSADIISVLGKDGGIRKVNPAIHTTLGYSQEEIIHLNYNDLIHPDDLKALEEFRNKSFREDEVAHYETRWRAKSGEYKFFSWSVTPFLEGELFFVVGKDITEIKEKVKAIQEQNKKLAEIAWEQSHVVRAPLSRLLACVAFLEEHEEIDHPLLQNIKETAHELDEIVKSIVVKTESLG